MKYLKITKGEWYIKHRFNVLSENDEYVCSCGGQRGNMSPEKQTEMNEANAELIADAGTTVNKCNLLPSELLDQRDELFRLLEKMTNYLNGMDSSNRVVLRIPLKLSKKIGETIQSIKKAQQ